MNTSTLSTKQIFFIGLMLFSLFFGAGNLIFPPFLGYEAGENFWFAMLGFLLSGVGLPILGVLAIVYTGSDDAEAISKRVHPLFATLFTTLTFLAIGPLFAVPRTAAVSYEIGVTPFLDTIGAFSLLVFSLLYFAIVYWLAATPGKFIDRIGKIITPFLLVVLAILLFSAVFGPLGSFTAPTDVYDQFAFFSGFTEGYLTMDTIAAFVFGILVLEAIRSQGVNDPIHTRKITWESEYYAALLLSIIYTGLGYLGAVNANVLGDHENGGQILQLTAFEYFGLTGNVLLALAIILACIPTAVGLIASCARYFNRWFPSVSYRLFVFILTLFSFFIANMGLDTLISFSLPVLTFIYPIIIVLIVLAFTHNLFGGRTAVYRFSVTLTAIVSAMDGLDEANLLPNFLDELRMLLPLSQLDLGWVVPALVGAAIGYLVSRKQRNHTT
ncbi:LOW QUALITY PROTEIN: branched-chain amino acid transport system carrier protein [Geomicrobium sp. JCM 19037]|nr:LOW QUALITY PROTEIN: branched-chain amino acid transport system carrier protein [Geomicrobium sp. JCM 19037]